MQSPTLLRRCAHTLVCHAAAVLEASYPGVSRSLLKELDKIDSQCEALVWAVGCVWAARVELFLTRARPLLIAALLPVGLYIALDHLFEQLIWYGFSAQWIATGSDVGRYVVKLVIFAALLVFVEVVTPGCRGRRLFGAVAFPIIAMLAVLASQLASQLVEGLHVLVGDPLVGMMLGLPLFGFVVALVLSLPVVLLYRNRAIPIAILALMPEIAKAVTVAGKPEAGVDAEALLFESVAPFVYAVVLIVLFSIECDRWLRRDPES